MYIPNLGTSNIISKAASTLVKIYVVRGIRPKFVCAFQIYASVDVFAAYERTQKFSPHSTHAIRGLSVFSKTSKRFVPQHRSSVDVFFVNAVI